MHTIVCLGASVCVCVAFCVYAHMHIESINVLIHVQFHSLSSLRPAFPKLKPENPHNIASYCFTIVINLIIIMIIIIIIIILNITACSIITIITTIIIAIIIIIIVMTIVISIIRSSPHLAEDWDERECLLWFWSQGAVHPRNVLKEANSRPYSRLERFDAFFYDLFWGFLGCLDRSELLGTGTQQ